MVKKMNNKSYSELIKFETFEDRFKYLMIGGEVGAITFGGHRYANQAFYTSPEWRSFRRNIIIRDNGCDLGIDDRMLDKFIVVHHINPITIEDILERHKCVLDPENVISVSSVTHKAIHYGDLSILVPSTPVERRPNDTIPWRKSL